MVEQRCEREEAGAKLDRLSVYAHRQRHLVALHLSIDGSDLSRREAEVRGDRLDDGKAVRVTSRRCILGDAWHRMHARKKIAHLGHVATASARSITAAFGAARGATTRFGEARSDFLREGQRVWHRLSGGERKDCGLY